MRCTSCGFEDPTGMPFCGACGTPLTRPAPISTPTEPGQLRDTPQDQPAPAGPPSAERTEAQELLAKIYSWFTEGFDTADLQAARALPEELA
jgi:hypothetical protein